MILFSTVSPWFLMGLVGIIRLHLSHGLLSLAAMPILEFLFSGFQLWSTVIIGCQHVIEICCFKQEKRKFQKYLWVWRRQLEKGWKQAAVTVTWLFNNRFYLLSSLKIVDDAQNTHMFLKIVNVSCPMLLNIYWIFCITLTRCFFVKNILHTQEIQKIPVCMKESFDD